MLSQELQSAIAKVNSTIATMEVETEVKKGVKKVAKVSVVLGKKLSFARIVNNRRKKEGLDGVDISGRVWGQHIPNTPFIWHNGNLYMECLVLKTLSEQYFKDGVEIDKQEVFSGGQAPDVYGLGKKSPKWRTYKLSNVNSVRSKKIV
jgi:hypothetical protein